MCKQYARVREEPQPSRRLTEGALEALRLLRVQYTANLVVSHGYRIDAALEAHKVAVMLDGRHGVSLTEPLVLSRPHASDPFHV